MVTSDARLDLVVVQQPGRVRVDEIEDLARGGHEFRREGAVFRGRGALPPLPVLGELREAHLEAALDRLLPA